MVITLTDVGTKKGTADDIKMYIPVIPSEIKYSTATLFQEYKIINKGPAKVPTGQEIVRIGWESFFPGNNIKNMPFVNRSTSKSAIEFHKQIEAWRNAGSLLKLNITGTPFSFDVYIESYDVQYHDAHGCIYYTIEFSKAVTISVTTAKEEKKTTTKTTGTNRTSKTSNQKKHTVKKGDTLWGISKKYYKTGTKWKTIYNENKTTIENAAKKHKKKSSENGHWIYPGTVLKIPA